MGISETMDLQVGRERVTSLNRWLFGALSSTRIPAAYSAPGDGELPVTGGVEAGAVCLRWSVVHILAEGRHAASQNRHCRQTAVPNTNTRGFCAPWWTWL